MANLIFLPWKIEPKVVAKYIHVAYTQIAALKVLVFVQVEHAVRQCHVYKQ